jgi:hypothetical protein
MRHGFLQQNNKMSTGSTAVLFFSFSGVFTLSLNPGSNIFLYSLFEQSTRSGQRGDIPIEAYEIFGFMLYQIAFRNTGCQGHEFGIWGVSVHARKFDRDPQGGMTSAPSVFQSLGQGNDVFPMYTATQCLYVAQGIQHEIEDRVF